MFSKLSLSIAAAIAAAGGVAHANPTPTSTDQARALAGQVITQQPDATRPADGPETDTDQAREVAGRSLPDASGAWVDPTLERNTDEARAAESAGEQEQIEKDSSPTGPTVAGAGEQPTDGR